IAEINRIVWLVVVLSILYFILGVFSKNRGTTAPAYGWFFLTKLVSFQVVDAKHVRPSCFPVIVDGAAKQLTHILLRGTRNSLSRGAVAGIRSHTTLIMFFINFMDHKIGHDDFGFLIKVAIKKIDTNASQEFLNEYKITFLKYNIFNLFFGTHIVAIQIHFFSDDKPLHPHAATCNDPI
ncbi:hypothetical protein ACJX0J_017041, partial [Zea mays]